MLQACLGKAGDQRSVFAPFPGIPQVDFRCPAPMRSLGLCSIAVKRHDAHYNSYKEKHLVGGWLTVSEV